MLFMTARHELCTRFVLGERMFILLKLRKMFEDKLENRKFVDFTFVLILLG